MAPLIENEPIVSAAGILSMLTEEDEVIQHAALKRLLAIVDSVWHEVAEQLGDLEAMSEDLKLPKPMRETAAAVASRVFFHLNEPYQALRLALESNLSLHFDVSNKQSVYVDTLVSAAIDAYIKLRTQDEEDLAGLELEKLSQVVELMFERCYSHKEYSHALGVAIEAGQINKVKEVLERAGSVDILDYALHKAQGGVNSKSFRDEVLKVIAGLLIQYETPWSILSLCTCYQLLNESNEIACLINKLFKKDEFSILLGYQICFDLVDAGDENLVGNISSQLDGEEEYIVKARKILVGGLCSELSLSFMHTKNESDPLVMLNLKKTLEDRGSSRNSLLHNCAVVTHAFLNAGTTNDSFLREHLDWMRKASNWSKFSATASLGLIHAGHVTQAMTLLEPYLPKLEGGALQGGGFAEGGSLFALGLIHGSHCGSSVEKRKDATEFLRSHLRASHSNEVISHGAALGVGLTALGSSNMEVVNELKDLLYTDSAVAGEAAGISIGLVLAGSGVTAEISDLIGEIKNYARETQHEKIIRGISMALALVSYGQQDNADELIEEMKSDRDPILRYGAQYAIALAYCGTGSNKAIRLLLHTAVSDVSDDVRMAAVISIAFVLYKTPHRVPQLVKLLLESFNPHVRYASCMAVGIAMAGSGDVESISLLEPMLDDMTDFVRQGALLGTAMIYMQRSDSCKKIKSFREKLLTTIGDKHQTTLTKMGAILSTGLIDAGGRNCSIDLGSIRNGFTKKPCAIGLVLFLQHWHWYPFMHMLSLALTPNFTIALTKDFKYPKHFEIVCNSKPSVFAYPKKLEPKKTTEKKRLETVTLSTTAKNKARLARKRQKEEAEPMEVDNNSTTPATPATTKPKKKQPEPNSYQLQNPCRITKFQQPYCEFSTNRYKPVREDVTPMGIIVLQDTTPMEEDEDLVEAVQTPEEDEAPMPEPFLWTPPNIQQESSDKKEETAAE